MRKIIAALAVCLALTACGRWEDEIRFEVTRIDPCYDGYSDTICTTRLYLKPVGDLPSGAPAPDAFKDAFVEPDDFASDGVTATTGDEIICAAREVSDGFEYLNGLPLTLEQCRKA